MRGCRWYTRKKLRKCKLCCVKFFSLHVELIVVKNDILCDLITMHKCHVFLTVVEKN
jgi:hypothetical protein